MVSPRDMASQYEQQEKELAERLRQQELQNRELEEKRILNERKKAEREQKAKQVTEERELQRAEKKEQRLKEKELHASAEQKRNKQIAETLFKESLYLFSVGNFSEAMTRCEKAIQHYPHANLHLLRAWISVADDEDEKYIIKDCTEALALNPELYDARLLRGQTMMLALESNMVFFTRKRLRMTYDDFCSVPQNNKLYQEASIYLSRLESKEFQSKLFKSKCIDWGIIGSIILTVVLLVIIMR